MKKLTRFLPLLLLTIALLALPACAHFTKSSTTEHALVKYGAAVPPDWRVIVPTGQLNLPADETNGYTDFAFVGETNSASGLFANHPRIFVAYRETWTDRSKGGRHVPLHRSAGQPGQQQREQPGRAGGQS